MLKSIKRYPVIFLCLLVVTGSCSAQQSNFNYKKVPLSYIPNEHVLAPFRVEAKMEAIGSYDLTNCLPPNYVKDGTVDYSSYLQTAMDKNDKVIFPDFPVLVSEKGLAVKSNSVLIFRKQSRLIIKPNNLASYQILRVYNVQNVKIYFPNLQGDRSLHTGVGGDWGMGIAINGCLNVKVVNPIVKDCWGDGIYIGAAKTVNRNIDIYYAQLDNNRRNGLSVICANGLNLKSPLVANSNGTSPMCGIDIEPYSNDNVVDNITIDHPITFNNVNWGLLLELNMLYGKQSKNINIDIRDHLDDGSKNGFSLFLSESRSDQATYSGAISVINPTWKNNQNDGFAYYKTSKNGLKVNFKNIRILKKDMNGIEKLDVGKVLETKQTIEKGLNVIVN